MSGPLQRALIVAVPVFVLLALSIVRRARAKTLSTLLQLLGTACLIIVVLTHVAEGLALFQSMGWGEPHSLGHYVDLTSALLGGSLLVAALVTHVLRHTGERA
jgi:formate hydrogenlyase subunit 3/multisubunit Na+/H+ antiporter MnhD subunit